MASLLKYTLRLEGVNQPGLLPSVAQAFSCIDLAVESFHLERNPADPRQAVVRIVFASGERVSDLIRRKLARLIDVLKIVLEAETQDPSNEDPTP